MSASTPAAPPALLLSEREAARLLGICPRTLYSLAAEGMLPVIRIGRRKLYSREALAGYIARRESASLAGQQR